MRQLGQDASGCGSSSGAADYGRRGASAGQNASYAARGGDADHLDGGIVRALNLDGMGI